MIQYSLKMETPLKNTIQWQNVIFRNLPLNVKRHDSRDCEVTTHKHNSCRSGHPSAFNNGQPKWFTGKEIWSSGDLPFSKVNIC